MVYESSHQKQCNKASIRIIKQSKEPELIETEGIDSETNEVGAPLHSSDLSMNEEAIGTTEPMTA